MKPRLCIVMLVFALTVTCTPSMQVVEPVETSSPELSAIDSLMWQRPDSALACLLPYYDTYCRDVSRNVSEDTNDTILGDVSGNVFTTYNHHYANLLLAELLYKNDSAQTNRGELLQAVSYFDSITSTLNDHPHASWRHGGLEPPSPERNDNLIFLDARAHYINGVGYYENDSMVEACKEYLKALEVMEEQFEEKDLIGKKAKFMVFTNNRLMELFSFQFMMEPAIACGENVLFYCQIEPSLSQEIPNTLYHIGKQYDKKGNKNEARVYYEQAIERMSNSNTLVYRDMVCTKALNDYQVGLGMELSLKTLRQILSKAQNEKEQLARFLTIGDIFFEERIYDSALFYLKHVYDNSENIFLQIQATEFLHLIYDSLGDSENSGKCMRFLAQQKKTEGQNKALVSQLNDMLQHYMKKKQKKQAEEEREIAIKRIRNIIIPIAVAVALVIIVIAKLRGKKLLKEQQAKAERMLGETEQQHKEELMLKQAEAKKMLEKHQKEMEAKETKARKELEERDKAIEAERQTYRMEQAALSGRLKRSNQEIRELKDQMKLQKENLPKKDEIQAAFFFDEPICCLIMERVNEGQFKAKIDCEIYKHYALDKQQLLDLRRAADRHFSQFTLRLRKAYPKLTNIDIDYCCLYLLNLTHADISALMQRAYNTVVERDSKIQKVFDTEKPLPVILMEIAQKNLSI